LVKRNSWTLMIGMIFCFFLISCLREERPTIYLPKVTEPEITHTVPDFNERWIAHETKENVKNVTLWLLDIETRNLLQRKRIKYLEDLLNYQPEKRGELQIEKKSVEKIDLEYKESLPNK